MDDLLDLFNHLPQSDLANENKPLVMPTYQCVKFTLPTLAAIEDLVTGKRRGYLYSRAGNPTVETLVRALSQAQGTETGLAFGSGIAAINAVLFGSLKQGDHVLGFLECYAPVRYLVGEVLARFGVTSDFVGIEDTAAIESILKTKKTRLVMVESPTNPQLSVIDLSWLCSLAHKHGAQVVLDNTFCGFHNHREIEADYFVHSLTKYASGHGDVMGGVVLGSQKAIESLGHFSIEMGAVLDPHAASMILRGLKTYSLRYMRSAETAAALARWLEDQPQVLGVRYPGLTSHPQHELAKAQLKDFGGVIQIDLKDRERLHAFFDRLKIFRLSPSIGACESLAAPVALFYAKDLSPEQKKKAYITDASVRLAIGVESLETLQKDLSQALS